MQCLSPAFWEAVFVWLVVLIAVIALLRLLIAAIAGVPMWPLVATPWNMGQPAGLTGYIAAVINILIWAAICIALIYFTFALLGCLFSATGGLPRLPR